MVMTRLESAVSSSTNKYPSSSSVPAPAEAEGDGASLERGSDGEAFGALLLLSCAWDGLSLRRLRTGFILEKHDLHPPAPRCYQTKP